MVLGKAQEVVVLSGKGSNRGLSPTQPARHSNSSLGPMCSPVAVPSEMPSLYLHACKRQEATLTHAKAG